MKAGGHQSLATDPQSGILSRARWEVKEIIKAPREKLRVNRFPQIHYPFFHETVQAVLMERHPENWQDIPYYAVDAYLWAEQYGLAAYGSSPLRSSVALETQASFYFAYDLRWFARL